MKTVYRGVRALGDLAGSLLLIGTLLAMVLHLLHGLWPPIPDLLPMVALPQ